MSTLNSSDALALAKLFREGALAIGNYQLTKWDDLTVDQRQALTGAEHDLLDRSQSVITSAVGLVLTDAQTSLDEIKKATNDANEAIKTVSSIKKGVNIATAMVALGAAITAGNPSGIASAVDGLVEAV